MTSLTFNPITVALAATSIIFIASILLPEDAWERFKDWAWHSDSDDGPQDERRMPWERRP